MAATHQTWPERPLGEKGDPGRKRGLVGSRSGTLGWMRVLLGVAECLLIWGMGVGTWRMGGGLAVAATYRDSEYLIDSWETDDGLPENSATAMVQTPDGYLWFGTFNGLVRFDGGRFTVFDPSNNPGLPSPGIVNLHLDRAGRLWVSTLRGLVVSEPAKWTQFHPVAGWTSDYVREFAEEAGVFVVTGFDGKVFQVQGDRVEALPDPPGLAGTGCVCHVDGAGRIWVLRQLGMFFGSWEGGRWVGSPHGPEVFDGFVSMGTSRDGSLLVVNRNGVLRFVGEELRARLPVRWDAVPEGAWGVHEDHRGNIWLASAGLYRVTPEGAVRRFTMTNGLSYDSLRFVHEDHERNLWVGTSGGGLMRFKARTFLTYGEDGAATERNVKAVLEWTPGRMVFGTYRGGLLGLEGDRVVPWPAERQPASRWLQCLVKDRRGALWAGGYAGATEPSSISVLTGTGWETVPPEIGGRSTEAIFEDSRGRVWVGGYETVTVFEAGRPRTFPVTDGLRLRAIHAFAEDVDKGWIWATGGEGLYRWQGERWEQILGGDGMSVKDGQCLRVQTGGTLWVGGAGMGLRRYRGGQWSAVGEAQGLPVRHIGSILDDGLGFWWLGSNRGVLRVARRDVERAADGQGGRLVLQQFDLHDGLASVECSMGVQSPAVRASDGRLWFATMKGVAVVDPARLHLNTNPPPIRIEGIRVEDSQGVRREVSARGDAAIDVPPDAREVEVYLSALSFTAPEKVRFEYRLEGVDAEWRSLGGQRSLVFYRPAPGRYRLLARAANNDGLWNEAGAMVAFNVQPQAWETLWFRALAVVVLGGGIGWAVAATQRNRLKRSEDQLRQERALAAERARSSALIQHASDAILVVDREGRLIFCSPSARRLLPIEPGSGPLVDLFHRVHPEDAARVRGELETVASRRQWRGISAFRFQDANGRWLHFEAVAENLLEQPGVGGILVTARDVTERRRAEAETKALQTALIEAQRMEAIGQLAGGVAHDFNNILAVILMNASMLLEEPDLSEEVRTGLVELESEAQRAANLTRQLLMFSRRQAMEVRTFELRGLVEDLLKMLRRVLGERATLALEGPEGDLWLAADPAMIERVVLNLVVNARDAMPQGGRLTLTLGREVVAAESLRQRPEAREGRFVVLSVADTGVGMDETTRQRIFEPFFTTKEAGKGTGLGLATVYGIVKQHQGWIEVESEPGCGTVFRVLLPEAERAEVGGDTRAESFPKATGTETILLVEDAEKVRRVAAQLLQRLGYQVIEAGSGPEAVALWPGVRDRVDLLLTDMVMPGELSGRDLGIRLHRDKPSLRCLLMSGYSPDLAEGAALLGHESGFIPKPFEPATLARRVRECLDRR